MTTKTYNQISIDAAVRAMLELPVGTRKAARDAIAITILHQAARLARGWCRASGDFDLTQMADAEAEGVCFYLEALQELAEGRVPEGVRSWDAYLDTRVTFQISAWLKSSTMTSLPGSSSALRRATRAAHFISRFEAEHGREPSAPELMEVFNAEMRGRRADPRKQGALISLSEARAALGHNSMRAPRMSVV